MAPTKEVVPEGKGRRDRFNIAIIVAVGVTLAIAIAIAPLWPAESAAQTPNAPTTVSYLNLTVVINASTGWPQYSPANFSVPAGLVVLSITDYDTPFNWSAPVNGSSCPCDVLGTVQNTELINGTPYHRVSDSNVAHTFTVPKLGLNVLSPGGGAAGISVVAVFSADHPGTYQWWCMAPCGAGSDPMNTPPMNVVGYMSGFLTVT